mmetsp:Transcript_29620/g.42290  ORF Transcript_29620/g.42290 Transcript_29620/m.42290 type:complete len:140 (+) Transcript_29620:10-429(+)
MRAKKEDRDEVVEAFVQEVVANLKGKRKNLTSSDRERMVNLFTQGFSYSLIAREYGVFPSTVWRLVQKFKCTGSSERLSGSGRRRKTTAKEDSLIVKEVRKNHHRVAVHRIRKDLELEKVSCQTIRRRITEFKRQGSHL